MDNGQIILDGILDCFLDCFLDVVLDGTLDWFGWELGLVCVLDAVLNWWICVWHLPFGWAARIIPQIQLVC